MSTTGRERSIPPWDLASNESIAPLTLRSDTNALDSDHNGYAACLTKLYFRKESEDNPVYVT